MLRYDVIVCGAGPAGAMAAYRLAKSGLKVALLEKHLLPRHKTCGGGIPVTMERCLADVDTSALIESEVTFMRHSWKFEDSILAAINLPGSGERLKLWMVQRHLFDFALAQHAAAAGAELKDGLAVRSVEPNGNHVVVRAQWIKTNGEVAKGKAFNAIADYVIGADGANGVTVKATNLRQNPPMAIAMEVEYPHVWGTGHPHLSSNTLHLDYGAIGDGYAWVFPKKNHLNVGAGLFRMDRTVRRSESTIGLTLKQVICNYLTQLHVPFDCSQMRFHAHPLPLWRGKEPRHTTDGRILLVGDAAGLVGPLFGDGLLHGVKSGLIAAECIKNGTSQEYTNCIHDEFAANFDAALKLSRFFYQWPYLCYKFGVKQERATPIAARLLAGELGFQEMGDRFMQRMKQQMTGLMSVT
ncbi:MAG: geranylgeranyl reductase family protein [Synechococcales bacterium]|nr:geranylgeranyl reductase family protein [Cyanobacteria bacterium REEB444]MEB3125779.1 geranylgeranyl reductase family protein [Synechococcales bacterium]